MTTTKHMTSFRPRRATILLVLLLLLVFCHDATSLKHRRSSAKDKGKGGKVTKAGKASKVGKDDKFRTRLIDQQALVLTLDSSTTASSAVVVDVFEESLREISRSRESHFVLLESPVVVTEVNNRGYNLIVVCIETMGEYSMDGLQEFSDQTQRGLKKRRGGSTPWRSRKGKGKNDAVTVNNLLDLVNSKTSSVQLDGLYSTDLIPCPTPAPVSNPPSQTPTTASRPSSKKPSSGAQPTSGIPKAVSPSMLLQPSISPTTSPSKPVGGKGSKPTPPGTSPSRTPHKPTNGKPASSPNTVPTAPTTSMPSSVDSTPTSFPTSMSPSQTPQPSQLITTMEPSQTWSPSKTPQPSNTPQPSQFVLTKKPSESPSPSTSFQPSSSMPPSLPPPDWKPFGGTILGFNIKKIVYSDDGTFLGSVFTPCTTSDGGCGRLYDNPNRQEWNLVGSDVVADLPDHTLVDLALSGDGTTWAVVSQASAKNTTTGMQERRVQIMSASPTNDPIGDVIVDELDFTTKSVTSICLSTDGSLLTMGMANGETGVNLIQAWSLTGNAWEKLGNVLNTTQSNTAMEFSGECKTVVLTNLDSQTSIYTLKNTDWVSQDTGLPSNKFSSVVIDGSGSRIATRSFVTAGSIDIYDLVQNIWTKTFSISSNQIYEGTFGFELDLNSQGNMVAVATFRVEGQVSIACAQAFQYNSTAWNALGRPPCNAFEDGHAGFGSFLSLAGDGQTIAVGDIGNFNDPLDSGHIHTYEYVERV